MSLRAPRKIRNAGIIVCILGFSRYAVLLMLYVAGNIEFLYLLKPAAFLQYIYIPVIAVSSINICMKKSKFSYTFSVLALTITAYVVLMLKLPISIEYIQGNGYVMNFLCSYFVHLIYFAFNTMVFFASFILFKKNYILIRLSALVSMVEIAMSIYGIPVFVYCVSGELLWFITFLYSLNKVKKQV